MRVTICLIGFCMMLHGCSQHVAHDRTALQTTTPQQNLDYAGVSEDDHASSLTNLIGHWETTSIESNIEEWKEAKHVEFFVYSFPKVRPGATFQPVDAELLIQKNDGKLRPAYDCQPVYMSRGLLCFGPIGSAYRFKFSVEKEKLSMFVISNDGAYLRFQFRLISRDSGSMRFPPTWKQ